MASAKSSGLAGTVARWTDAGIEVTYCIITDGDAGGFDPAVPRDQIGGIRRDEQRAAAKEVGVSDVRFLGSYPRHRWAPDLDHPVPAPAGLSDVAFAASAAWVDPLRHGDY